jgi:hypothetical protein
MRATQGPLPLAALTENATSAGMEDHPVVASRLLPRPAIAPEAVVFMAERIGGTTEHVDGSHTTFVAQPSVAAALIVKAAAG